MNVSTTTQEQAQALIDGLDARAERHDITVDECRVCWRRFGSGTPLVLLHGGHGSWLHWVRNIDALASRFSVWVPDMPGYGDSDEPSGTGLSALLDATIGSLDELVGADREIDLAGFSFGGLVASHVAARRRHVRRLALLGPGGHAGPRRPRAKLRDWKPAAAAHDAAALADVMRHNLFTHMLRDPDSIDALALHLHTQACLHTRFRSRVISQAGGLRQVLEGVGAELWIAWGEHDVTADPAVAIAMLAAGHPERRVRIIEGAGHWLQYERADEVNRLLLDWFGDGAT